MTGASQASLPSSTRMPSATAVKTLVFEAMPKSVLRVDGGGLAELADAVSLGDDDPAVLDDGQGDARDLERREGAGDGRVEAFEDRRDFACSPALRLRPRSRIRGGRPRAGPIFRRAFMRNLLWERSSEKLDRLSRHPDAAADDGDEPVEPDQAPVEDGLVLVDGELEDVPPPGHADDRIGRVGDGRGRPSRPGPRRGTRADEGCRAGPRPGRARGPSGCSG